VTGAGFIVLLDIAAILAGLALARGGGTFGRGMERALEQAAQLVPRMVCALIAAGFIAKLMPSTMIARYLGEEAGFSAIPIAAGAGLLLPAGPVIAFAVAAVFARADASIAALVAFITSWSLFAAHRIFMYEIPMLGVSFLRLRAASVAIVPILAGVLAMLAGLFVTLAQPGQG
jgi:uncharacterized membrane protein YraQ (UPF0718 family)